MEISQLLERSEQRQVQIIYLLLERNGSATIKEIAEHLNAYRNTIKEDIECLQLVFSTFNHQVELENNDGVITLETFGKISNLEVFYYFVENSTYYQILMWLLDYGRFDIQSLAMKLTISEATLSRRIKGLNELLAEFDLKIKNGILVGSELQIRYFYFLLLWFGRPYHVNQENMIDKSSIDLIQILEESLGFPFAEDGKIKLKIWLVVTKKRLVLFSNEETTEEFTAKEYRFSDNLFKELYRVLSLFYSQFAYNWDYSEAVMFYLFLLSNFTLEKDNPLTHEFITEVTRKNYPVAEMNAEVLRLIREIADTSKFSAAFRFKAITTLFRFHYRIYYFKGNFTFLGASGLDHLRDDLPDERLVDVSEVIVKRVLELANIPESDRAYTGFFLEEYYLSLIYLAYRDLEFKLKVGCDFPFERDTADVFIDYLANRLDPRLKVDMLPYEEGQKYDLIVTNIQKNYPGMLPDQVYILFSVEYSYDVPGLEDFLGQHYHDIIQQRVIKK